MLDRIVEQRSPGRPLRHPRTGRLVDFLLTHQGRRVSAVTPETDWRAAPPIKARLGAGYSLRSLVQAACPCTNICEHCPNFRSESSLLPVLATQRADTDALAQLRPGQRLRLVKLSR
jgi:hypothetical protein